MGARLIRKRGSAVDRRRKESITLAIILAAVGLPITLAYVLVAADMRSDLSELKPAHALPDKTTALIGWPDLETDPERSASAVQTPRRPPQKVRMLGYMMDGYQPSPDGAQVRMFILMPEAGQFLHPAHRIPDEMVEVWLLRPLPFQYRRLIWASGLLARVPGRRISEKASYAMTDASAQPAVQTDISRWFRP